MLSAVDRNVCIFSGEILRKRWWMDLKRFDSLPLPLMLLLIVVLCEVIKLEEFQLKTSNRLANRKGIEVWLRSKAHILNLSMIVFYNFWGKLPDIHIYWYRYNFMKNECRLLITLNRLPIFNVTAIYKAIVIAITVRMLLSQRIWNRILWVWWSYFKKVGNIVLSCLCYFAFCKQMLVKTDQIG